LDKGDCKALGMGLFLGVAQGSEQPPCLIHLAYQATGTSSHQQRQTGQQVEGEVDAAPQAAQAGQDTSEPPNNNNNNNSKHHVVALVGKGLTFDSGGYNLKTGGGIETMKCDMGGAAAVLGAARALVDLRPDNVEVRGVAAWWWGALARLKAVVVVATPLLTCHIHCCCCCC
jgi:leucyl aminopeptidase